MIKNKKSIKTKKNYKTKKNNKIIKTKVQRAGSNNVEPSPNKSPSVLGTKSLYNNKPKSNINTRAIQSSWGKINSKLYEKYGSPTNITSKINQVKYKQV